MNTNRSKNLLNMGCFLVLTTLISCNGKQVKSPIDVSKVSIPKANYKPVNDSLTTIKKYSDVADMTLNSCNQNTFDFVLTDSKKDVFWKTTDYVPFFEGDEKASLKSLSYNSSGKPVIIKTSKSKLVFNNVSPDYEEKQENYFNFGYNERLGKHLVFAVYYEGSEYFLIDDATNHVDTLQSKPYFSSNGRYIFTFFINPFMDTEINGNYPKVVSDVIIYEKCDQGFEAIIKKSYEFIPIEIKWKNNSTVVIEAAKSDEYYKKMSGQDTIITNFIYKELQLKVE